MVFLESALLFVSTANALVLAPNVTRAEPSWQPESKSRGTWRLLFSCTITMCLCLWVSIHEDVELNRNSKKRLLSKIGLVIFGVLAPEKILFSATSQLLDAKHARKKWDEKVGVLMGPYQSCFGLEGGFFLCMGGFTLGKPDCFGHHPRAITRKEFELLTLDELSVPPELNRSFFAERGKSNALAKLLTAFQVLGMFIEFGFRQATGLPVTILEIHVIVHVLRTAALYGLYWYKPQGVLEPIPIIKHAELNGVLAFVYHGPVVMGVLKTGSLSGNNATSGPACLDAESWYITSNTPNYRRSVPDQFKNAVTLDTSHSRSQPQSHEVDQPQPLEKQKAQPAQVNLELSPGETLYIGTGFLVKNCEVRGGETVTLNPDNIEAMSCQAVHIRTGAAKENTFIQLNRESREPGCEDQTKESSPWGMAKLRRLPILTLVILPALDAVTYCLAWNNFYPTQIEQSLWRLSCISLIMFPLVGMFTLHYERASKLVVVVLQIVAYLCVYIFCNKFLLIEAFISVRRLPEGAYQIVPWENIWPHL